MSWLDSPTLHSHFSRRFIFANKLIFRAMLKVPLVVGSLFLIVVWNIALSHVRFSLWSCNFFVVVVFAFPCFIKTHVVTSVASVCYVNVWHTLTLLVVSMGVTVLNNFTCGFIIWTDISLNFPVKFSQICFWLLWFSSLQKKYPSQSSACSTMASVSCPADLVMVYRENKCIW